MSEQRASAQPQAGLVPAHPGAPPARQNANLQCRVPFGAHLGSSTRGQMTISIKEFEVYRNLKKAALNRQLKSLLSG
jgi:hypothetical protein